MYFRRRINVWIISIHLRQDIFESATPTKPEYEVIRKIRDIEDIDFSAT